MITMTSIRLINRISHKGTTVKTQDYIFPDNKAICLYDVTHRNGMDYSLAVGIQILHLEYSKCELAIIYWTKYRAEWSREFRSQAWA